MKIQKGILSDTSEEKPSPPPPEPRPHLEETWPAAPAAAVIEKNRLFETLEKEKTSGRSYAKLLVVAAVLVLIAGGIIFYMTLPGVGDRVRAPKGLEQAVRDHLLDKQKRVATDVVFYYCGSDSYWAHAGVETRTDIPNPVYKLNSYAVSAKGQDPSREISSKPIASPTDDTPCR